MIPALPTSFVRLATATVRRVDPNFDCDNLSDLHHFKMMVQDRETSQMASLYFRIENIMHNNIHGLVRDKEAMSELAGAVAWLAFTSTEMTAPGGQPIYGPPRNKKVWAEIALKRIEEYFRHLSGSSAIRSGTVNEPVGPKQVYLQLPGNIQFQANGRDLRYYQGVMNFFGEKLHFKFHREDENILQYVKKEALIKAYRETMQQSFGFLELLGWDSSMYPWNAELIFTKSIDDAWDNQSDNG